MHIRQLARDAALITVAAIVTAGFSAGIAQATSVAPTSTMSAASAPVTPGGTAARVHSPLMDQCYPYFCSLGISGHSFYIIQKFNCDTDQGHNAESGKVYALENNCNHRVYNYFPSGGYGCVSGGTTKSKSGGFSTIDYYFVDIPINC